MTIKQEYEMWKLKAEQNIREYERTGNTSFLLSASNNVRSMFFCACSPEMSKGMGSSAGWTQIKQNA